MSDRIMFTGQYYDSEIGQYYLRARQFDPILMRWTARDAHEMDFMDPRTIHRYLYCINSPTYLVDLNGENFSLPDLLFTTSYCAGLGAWGGFWYGLMNEVIAAGAGRNFEWGPILKAMGKGALMGGIVGGGMYVSTGAAVSTSHWVAQLGWTMVGGEISGAIFGDRKPGDQGKSNFSYIQFRNMEKQAGILLIIESDNIENSENW